MTMQVVETIAEARALLDAARRDGKSVGLVPTMVFLHDGHVSLMARAVADCDVVITTIFVNPLQFAANEDLSSYPRDIDSDTRRCAEAGVSVLLVPPVEEMYPEPVLTEVRVREISAPLEGASRPTHFAGVATVVAKLFNIGGPCTAYFGEKDWQQLQVIRRMASDLSFPVEVVGCPIVREPDGLAMSSRNTYLDTEHRGAATVLSHALRVAVAAVNGGETDAATIRALLEAEIAGEPRARLDYAAVVDAGTLADVERVGPGTRLLLAVQVGPARLIDNVDAHQGIVEA
jgi:pantoate--beta-alanine ligase